MSAYAYSESLSGIRIGGIPGFAVRLGRLLELWGRRAARAERRVDLQRQHRIERELGPVESQSWRVTSTASRVGS